MKDKILCDYNRNRSSNIELLRIIAMFFVVAHHFVVNSGIERCYNFDNELVKTLFLQLWGMWGKVSINVFVLITGFFMCTSQLTVKRYLKIFFVTFFYRIVLFGILVVIGYESLETYSITSLLFFPFIGYNGGFLASYLFFYLFIPYYNILLKNMDEKKHKILLVLGFMMQTVTSTLFFNDKAFNNLTWYVFLYFLAAFIRMYPMRWMNSLKLCSVGLTLCIFVSTGSVAAFDYLGKITGVFDYYFLVVDSNKLMALLDAMFLFLFFRNIQMPYVKLINIIASTTFGVLLIHAHSDSMRRLLWKDIFHVPELYSDSLTNVMLSAVFISCLVFAVCSIIDFVRISTIEKFFFSKLESHKWFERQLY